MTKEPIRTMVLIGAGRLGSAVVPALHKCGITVLQVYNRSRVPGRRLAKRVGSEYIDAFHLLRTDADLYLLAVSDDALTEVALALPAVNGLVVHTSGSRPLSLIGQKNSGVVYPLYSFSGRGKPEFGEIPFFVECGTPDGLTALKALAEKLSQCVIELNSEQRLRIHLAAVFASNFSNFMVSVAKQLLQETGASPEILDELLRKTARNMLNNDPFRYQTGPAFRGDRTVMEEHLRVLEGKPELQEIYKQLSAGIINLKKKHG